MAASRPSGGVMPKRSVITRRSAPSSTPAAAGPRNRIFATAEAEEVRDGFADLEHRQRLSDWRRHRLHQCWIGRVAPFDRELHGGDRLADVVLDGGVQDKLSTTVDTEDIEEKSYPKDSD